MAKIYETHQDFERDKLTEQISGEKHRAHAHDSMGWMALTGSFMLGAWNAAKETPSRLLSVLSTALVVGSVVEWVNAWRSNRHAHELQLERERLGPARVVLPPEDVESVQMPEMEKIIGKGAHVERLQQQTQAADLPLRSH